MASNTRFAVAVHILTVLGVLHENGVELVCSDQIAKSVNTNAVVIRNLLRALKQAKLVDSKEGKGGGVRLAKSAERITLQEIFEAVENGGVLCANRNEPYKQCPVSRGMRDAFAAVSDEVDGAVARVLRGKKLTDVMKSVES